MKFDLSNFKKAREDHESATFVHPDGHTIRVMKKHMKEDHKKTLSEIPKHMWSGGSTSDPNSSSVDDVVDQAAPVTAADQPSFARSLGEGVRSLGQAAGRAYDAITPEAYDPEKAAASEKGTPTSLENFMAGITGKPVATAEAPETERTPAQNSQAYNLGQAAPPTNQANPLADMYGQIKSGFGEQQAGLQKGYEAESKKAALDQEANAENIAKLQTIQSEHQLKWNQINKEYQHTLDDIKGQHINADQYMESKGTLGKVGTAIGLIMGGIGGGLTHQENPALKFLNSQIDRDVAAQKDNLGKKHTLLSSYMQQFGNLNDATNMATAVQKGLYATKLEDAAANTADLAAKSRLMQGAGVLKREAAQAMAPLALSQTAKNSSIDPATKIQFFAPPAQKEALMKDLQTKQNMDSANNELLKAFDYISAKNTPLNKLNFQEQQRMSSMIDSKLLSLARESAGRFNMEEIPMMKTMFTSALANPETKQVMRQNFVEHLASKSHFPSLQMYGVNSWQPGARPNMNAPSNYGKK